MGHWLSPDYDGDDDDPEPVPYANLDDPQSLNLCTYAGNSPLSRTDPTGHFQCTCPIDPDDLRLQQEEAQRQREVLQLMLYTILQMAKQRLSHPFSPPLLPLAGPSTTQPAPPDPNQKKDGKPKLKSNPKHHPNSESPEPNNAQELYDKAIKDDQGRWWQRTRTE